MVQQRFSQILLVGLILFPLYTPTLSFGLLHDPYQIMQSHYKAIGGLELLKKVDSSYSEGTVRFDGLQGTFKSWEKRPLKYRTEEDYSILSQVQGDSGTSAWLLDTNQQLLIFRDEQTLKRRQISIRLDRYEHLDPDSPYFSLTFAGISDVDSKDCYEVVLSNTINSDTTHFFFGADSLYIVKTVVHQPDMEMTTIYDDFRTIDGIVIPFYEHTRYMPWEKVEETKTTRYTMNEQVADTFFAVPVPKKDFQFQNNQTSATIPFIFKENLIYLPVTMAGDTRYWVLDTGASMSVIDQDYAQSLGLKMDGSIKGYGFGELFTLSFAEIPSFKVETIHFDQQTFYVSQGLTARSYEPEIYGILGYDFLSRFIVEVDYDTRNLTFHLPESFVYKGLGEVLNAPLKYRTFSIPVILDGKYKSRWTIDLGSFQSSIHYPFAEKNNLLERPGAESVSQGMSSISFERTTEFGCLAIGSFLLDTPLIAIPVKKGKGATALGEVGGNLGNSILKNFHLFLDYPGQKIIMEPGRNFNALRPRDTSGLIIGRSSTNQPMVSYVTSNSPAMKAGLIAGDIIENLAGIVVTPESEVIPLRKMLRDNAGQSVTIAVRRDAQQINTTITLENLYPKAEHKCRTRPERKMD